MNTNLSQAEKSCVDLTVNSASVAKAGERVIDLQKRCATGRVMCVFQRCAYAQFNEQLICIALSDIGMSSITAQLEKHTITLPISIRVGALASFDSSGLIMDDRDCLSMSITEHYVSPSIDWQALSNTESAVSSLIERIRIPQHGLAPLLSTGPQSTHDALLTYVKPGIQELLRQLYNFANQSKNTSKRIELDSIEYKKLIGAGPGLTPSGDDFFMGVFSALHVLNLSRLANALWKGLRAYAFENTTPVSFCLMECAVRAEFSDRQLSLMEMVLSYPHSSRRIICEKLDEIGQSSGWDWFTGFVLCIQALQKQRSL